MGLKNLRRSFDRFCFQNRNKGIPNLMLYIALGSALVTVMGMINGGDVLYSALCFNKSLILQGLFFVVRRLAASAIIDIG